MSCMPIVIPVVVDMLDIEDDDGMLDIDVDMVLISYRRCYCLNDGEKSAQKKESIVDIQRCDTFWGGGKRIVCVFSTLRLDEKATSSVGNLFVPARNTEVCARL